MPKIDLHRHFEGSLRLKTLAKIAQQHKLNGIPWHDLERFRPYVQVTDEPPNAHSFLAKFEVLRRFYHSPEIIRRMAYEIVADAAADNIHYLELRFSPQALSNTKQFPLGDVTDWVIESVHEASQDFEIDVNLIITLVRHNPVEQGREVAEIAFDRISKGIVGLDLAGDEVNYSATEFKDIFQEAKRLGMGITIHAGEWTGAESVREAVESLSADRIGHGVSIVSDPEIMRMVRERKVALEICLTSNMQTASVTNLPKHPIKKLLEWGVPVTLNTDDPTISNITLTDECYTAMDIVKLSYEDLYAMTLMAVEAAFVTEPERAKLRKHFKMALAPPKARRV